MSPVVESVTPAPNDAAFLILAIDAIDESPTNPRKHFNEHDLTELAASISEKGVMQPALVRPRPRNRYELVAGARRYRASKLAGVTTLPAIVRSLSDEDVLELQLIENIQRNDLTPLEEARGYKALMTTNEVKYSAAHIAEKIGRAERYVWDRIKLNDLVPEAQELLDANIILVGHAELLAKLTPATQKRALKLPTHGYGGGNGALFRTSGSTLPLDEETTDLAKKYKHVKPVSVREFEYWIAHDVRLDPAQAAAAAPLDFGDLPARIQEAEARPGRGKKWVAITHDYRVSDGARDEEQRTFGKDHWKTVTKPCGRQVLGVIVAGKDRGQAFDVCVNKDCGTHWAAEKRQREKVANARATGNNAKAKKAEDSWAERQRLEREERAKKQKRYKALYPLVIDALKAALPATLTREAFSFLLGTRKKEGASTPAAKFVPTLILNRLGDVKPNAGYYSDYDEKRLLEAATHFGVDVKKLAAQVKGDEPKPSPAAKKAKAKK